jgi:hypothetical protein
MTFFHSLASTSSLEKHINNIPINLSKVSIGFHVISLQLLLSQLVDNLTLYLKIRLSHVWQARMTIGWPKWSLIGPTGFIRVPAADASSHNHTHQSPSSLQSQTIATASSNS